MVTRFAMVCLLEMTGIGRWHVHGNQPLACSFWYWLLLCNNFTVVPYDHIGSSTCLPWSCPISHSWCTSIVLEFTIDFP